MLTLHPCRRQVTHGSSVGAVVGHSQQRIDTHSLHWHGIENYIVPMISGSACYMLALLTYPAWHSPHIRPNLPLSLPMPLPPQVDGGVNAAKT